MAELVLGKDGRAGGASSSSWGECKRDKKCQAEKHGVQRFHECCVEAKASWISQLEGVSNQSISNPRGQNKEHLSDPEGQLRCPRGPKSSFFWVICFFNDPQSPFLWTIAKTSKNGHFGHEYVVSRNFDACPHQEKPFSALLVSKP